MADSNRRELKVTGVELERSKSLMSNPLCSGPSMFILTLVRVKELNFSEYHFASTATGWPNFPPKVEPEAAFNLVGRLKS